MTLWIFCHLWSPCSQWPKQDKEWSDLQVVARALCYKLIVVDGNIVIWMKPIVELCLPRDHNVKCTCLEMHQMCVGICLTSLHMLKVDNLLH